ncbi:MAG TPA: hypothetical protein VIE66_15160 [Methylocella sp.]
MAPPCSVIIAHRCAILPTGTERVGEGVHCDIHASVICSSVLG